MGIIGYAAALEQFHPTELLHYAQLAEQHGFGAVMAAARAIAVFAVDSTPDPASRFEINCERLFSRSLLA